jgi:hypothetical protein
MPKQKDLKRRVRSRMRKTGESYTAARSRVVAKRGPAPADYAELAGMSDAAVQKKTDRTWGGWVRALDAAGAAELPHRDIARHVQSEYDVSGWWAQTITVGYERIRGLREKGQRRGGGYDVNKSKTYPVPVAVLYGAFGARKRGRWLDAGVVVKKATREKSMRLTFEDGTPVEVYFWEKGPAKSQVQLQHRKLPTRSAAERMRTFWTERLAALADELS